MQEGSREALFLLKENNSGGGEKRNTYLPLYKLEEFQPATSSPVIARNMQREE